MSGDCRLAGVREIDVQLAGSQLLIHASGVILEAGESGRIEADGPAPNTIYQVVACPDAEATSSRVVDLQQAFPDEGRVGNVVVEHAGGRQAFSVEPTIVCGVCGATNLASDEFCGTCGSFLHFASATPSPAPPAPSAAPPSAPPAPAPPSAGPTAAPSFDFPDMAGADFEPVDQPMPDMAAPEIVAADEPTAAAEPPTAAAEPPTSAAEPPTAAEPGDEAPPSSAKPRFPRLDAPPFAVVGKEFEVVVGVSPSEDPMVGGGALQLPSKDTFILSVQLIADGFTQADGSDVWEFDLAVTPNQQFPFVRLRLVADPIDDPGKVATLRLLYTVEGQVIGRAERDLAIVTEAAKADEVDLPEAAVNRAMAVPVGATAADLTVVIVVDQEIEGRLLWAFRTPHAVVTPKQDRVTHIGTKAEKFADDLRKLAEGAEGKPLLRQTLIGIGREIAKHVDPEFWRIFKEVAATVGGQPTVLFLLEEPHVPWELAVLPEADFPGEPRFVATEAVTGRWVLTDGPKLPPPELVEMKAMAVVFGEYKIAALKKLAEAEAEMKELSATYQASPVHATLDAVKGVLGGQPPADVLHFAIHGRFNAAGADLLMEDGQPLTSTAILGFDLASGPFVFLNACQVGAANALLGGYAGLVAAFTARGAAAAIAPLWSVSDVVAKDLSLRFYVGAFSGELPAEILRRERAKFAADPAPTSATPMAYQFYGHPAFRLTRTEEGPHA